MNNKRIHPILFKKNKQRSSDTEERFRNGTVRLRLTREQLICAAAAAALAAASWIVTSGSSPDTGGCLERGDPGTVSREYELDVSGIGEEKRRITVRVSPREFTEEEAAEKMNRLAEEIGMHILNGNESLGNIRSPLSLKKTIAGYEGIRLSWYPSDPELISYDGEIGNAELQSAVDTVLKVSMRAGEFKETFAFPVTVCPVEIKGEEDIYAKLFNTLEKTDRSTASDPELRLPEEIEGYRLSYSVPENNGWIGILGVGAAACILLGLKPEQDRKRKLKDRENELLMDYSEVVSKLIIYMGAGMTVRNAWIRIAELYETAAAEGRTEKRAVYEEMSITAGALEKGMPEGRAFSEFAGRCRVNCYLKLVSLLEQNRRIGDARSENAMLLEAADAFEQRKNTARRLGEEAGTKLMLPLMLSLMTVMMIVAIPAMMNLM
ncbi:MAG: hypothetical protein Q4D40_04530 [Eubacteriales bacterium]|nr:hypothetical protein [Eubacteriales bacterium]